MAKLDQDTVNQAERALYGRAPLLLGDSGYLKIQDKHGKIVPLILNKGQQAIRGTIEVMQARELPVRIYMPKARQFGGSTYVESVIYGDTSQRIGRNGYIIADEVPKAKNLYGMTRRYHRYMPDHLRYDLEVSNARELVFRNRESRLIVDSADKKDAAARSYTFQLAHVSEITRFPDQKGTMGSLMSTIPDHPDTIVVVESTCKGVGDYFHKEVVKAIQGKTDWAVCFVPWWWVEEYAMKVFDGWTAPLDAREEWLVRQGCLPDQLQWRRWAIENKCSGDDRAFDEEYPDSLERAFLVSGSLVFDVDAMQEMFNDAARLPPAYRGNLAQHQENVSFDINPRGLWQLWRRPSRGHEYVVGADFSEGLGQDETFVRVYDRHTHEFVAQLHTNTLDPEIAAEEISKIGHYFNTAFVVPEANAPGLAAIVVLRKLYPRRRIFSRVSSPERDRKGGRQRLLARAGEGHLGWKTTIRTKKMLIAPLATAIRELSFLDPSASAIGQFMTYTDKGDGSMGAQQGCMDDAVIASALAIMGDLVLPSPKSASVDFFKNNQNVDVTKLSITVDDW